MVSVSYAHGARGAARPTGTGSRLTQLHFFFVREIGGNFLRYFAGGGPFGSALEGCDEADAFLSGDVRTVVVAEGGVEDAAFAVIADHQERFVFARAGLFFCRKGARQDREILGGAAQAIVEI